MQRLLQPLDSNRSHTLLRLCLNARPLQLTVRGKILEKVADVMLTDDDSLQYSQGPVQGDLRAHAIPKRLLDQLCWLDTVAEPEELLTSLFEDVLPVAPTPLQKHILQLLPEIIDDSVADEAFKCSTKLVEGNPHLLSAALDLYSSLKCSRHVLDTFYAKILEELPSLPVAVMPALVAFLLSHADKDPSEVVAALREHVHFETLGGRENAQEALVVSTLSNELNINQPVAAAWIKQVRDTKSSTDIKVVDVVVLFILLQNRTHRKLAEKAVARCLKNGILTTKRLTDVLTVHAVVLETFFPTLLALAEWTLRAKARPLCEAGQQLYACMFSLFDAFCQQEQEPSGPCPCCRSFDRVLLRGIFEAIQTLSLSDVRKYFTILTTITVQQEDSDAIVNDETHILLRKLRASALAFGGTEDDAEELPDERLMKNLLQLLNLVPQKYESCLTSASELKPRPHDHSLWPWTHDIVLPSPVARLVVRSIRQDPATLSLFYDELVAAVLLQAFPRPMLERISMTFTDGFVSQFLVEKSVKLTSPIAGEDNLELSPQFGLSEEDEIAASFLEVLLQRQRADVLMPLFSQFKLMQSIHMILQGNLDQIDSINTCPIWMYNVHDVDFERMSNEYKDFYCHGILACVNWFRELLNAFAAFDTEHAVQRMRQMIQLEDLLERCLTIHSDFVPVAAHAEFQAELEGKRIVPNARRGGGGGGGGALPRRSSSAPTATDAEHGEASLDPGEPGTDIDGALNLLPTDMATGLPWEFKRFFMRELDLRAFTLLRAGSRDLLAEETPGVMLQPAEVLYLAVELEIKLRRALRARPLAFASNQSLAGYTFVLQQPADVIAGFAVGFTPTLCNLVEEAVSQLGQRQRAQLTGSLGAESLPEGEDPATPHGDPTHETTALQHNQCIVHVIKIFQHVLQWASAGAHKVHAQDFQLHLAVRVNQKEEMTEAEAACGAMDYLLGLCETVVYDDAFAGLLEVLQAMHAISAEHDEENIWARRIAQQGLRGLQRCWTKDPKRPVRPAHLATMLRTLLALTDDALETVDDLVCNTLLPLITDSMDSSATEPSAKRKKGLMVSEEYPTMCKTTFSTYLRECMTVLVDVVAKSDILHSTGQPVSAALSKMDHNTLEAVRHQLDRLTTANQTLSSCIRCIESAAGRNRSVLQVLYKSSRQYLELFVKHCTRILQRLCGHSKVEQDVALTAHVPPLRRVMDKLVFQTKMPVRQMSQDDAEDDDEEEEDEDDEEDGEGKAHDDDDDDGHGRRPGKARMSNVSASRGKRQGGRARGSGQAGKIKERQKAARGRSLVQDMADGSDGSEDEEDEMDEMDENPNNAMAEVGSDNSDAEVMDQSDEEDTVEGGENSEALAGPSSDEEQEEEEEDDDDDDDEDEDDEDDEDEGEGEDEDETLEVPDTNA
ncbi:uncharacterized protein MONBRDRAFT_24328 [Monosiga brevicollis MX1]|uniref:Fanconi anemia group D2 protein n=1 Tax=Monosiga brevicollis TaxID=81824 RepID=A9UW33_MONBE|nr:uncharacterized protein MONBRDRAFT_24328 [Monosiga brevicollis MX1]EDQ90492.1 predicted protein [Monosiga brevicollis MX1]|eukprot:XP_001744543.1 hypothetical protein [Monosiga brevicollis MX1]